MIVLSTNPILRDILDQSLLMTREYFFAEDDVLFKESMALAFIDNAVFEKEANFIRSVVKDVCKSKGIKQYPLEVVEAFISHDSIEVILISTNDDAKMVILVLFKIKGVTISMKGKKISADIKRLIRNILLLFVKTGIIEKLPENTSEVIDRIYEKVKVTLVATGSIKRVSRDWSSDE